MADIPVRVIINAIDNASKVVSGVGESLEDFSGMATKAGAGMLAVGAATLATTIGFVQQAGQMEQNQIAFETMLGSADKATKLLKEMSDFAATTPFEMTDVVAAGKMLLAYGFAEEKVIDTTRMLGDVSAGLNIPLNDTIYLFGTLRAQGRAYTKDLNQFTARGIPILDALAKQYGVTKDKVFDLASEGKVGFADVEKAFQGMTNEGGQFFNLMDKQSKSTLGTWSNLQDSITRVQITMGNALLPAVNDLMGALMPVITQFGAWAEQNPDLVKGLVIAGLAIGAIGAVLVTIGLIIPPIIAAVTLLGAVLAFVFAPVTLTILAVIAVIGLLYMAWRNNFMGIQQIAQTAIGFVMGVFQGLVAFIQGIPAWVAEAVTNTQLWFTNLVVFIQTLPALFQAFVDQLRASIYTFFIETLPFAIGWLAGRMVKFVTEDVPAFINAAVAWFAQLPARASVFLQEMAQRTLQAFITAKNWAIEQATVLVNNVLEWISTLPPAISDQLSQLPGIITAWFNSAKDAAVGKAREIHDGVREWFDKIVNFFKEIINWAGQAISKSKEAVSAGFSSGKRQFGGPVNAFNPVMVGEAGPEMFVPSTGGKIVANHEMGGRGGGSAPIQFIIQSPMIINSPTERRSIAEALYKDLVTLARSQNTSVAALMGA